MKKHRYKSLKINSIYYGWIVVACAFVLLFIALGSAYSFAAFFEPLQDEFQTSRGTTSLVFSIAGFLYFSLGAVSGHIADRIGSRKVIIFGIFLIGIALFLLSRAASIWQVYVIYGFGVGIGVGFVYVPAVGTVLRWFIRRRGLSSGLAVMGIGFGTMAMPVFSDLLIRFSDWRTAYLMMSLFVFALGISAALLIIDSPEKLGLLPDGDLIKNETILNESQRIEDEANIGNHEISLKEIIRTKPFWLLYAGALSSSFGVFIPFVHLVPYAVDLGFPASNGVMLISLIGIGSTAGRMLLGSIADKFGRRRSLTIMYAGIAVMYAWWFLATNFWELVCFAVIFGICYGGFVALLPAVTADYFSGSKMSGILGTLYTGVAIGNFIGPTFTGFIFDIQKSYSIPIVVMAIVMFFAAASASFLTDPIKWRESFFNSLENCNR
jgi:MFS family permease